MQRIFGRDRRYRCWRQLWIELARAQMGLGLEITPRQIAALEAHVDDFDWDRVAALEKELRHDVMAHLRAYGECCPEAGGILHLGATSCYVTDNADLILFREALDEVAQGLAGVLDALATFAMAHKDTPCVGYTHFQVAQLVTVGKRAALWAHDFLEDLREVERLRDGLRLRGVKGTTGTQASYMALFDGDSAKVEALDHAVAEAFGFAGTYPVTGQTYPRKLDCRIVGVLSGVAESAARFGTDIRLLSGLGELAEPRGSAQVGSSAMPYKRNPMRCERIVSLARLVTSLATSPPQTAANQWLERTLDDSANRRIVLPESFLAVDAILRLAGNVSRGLRVVEPAIARRLAEMMPFLATENIMMAAASAGGDRQELHEQLRVHTLAAWQNVEQGAANDLLDRIRQDPAFAAAHTSLDEYIRPEQYVGRAPAQVEAFIATEVRPALAHYSDAADWETTLQV
ncbi:adenylosuccinate lyase [bacterium AH-315-M10]|nr:adenylosuccinate lyase [bacterium AH-315-M10]